MKHILAALLLFLSLGIAQARPAYPGVLYATLEDGTRVAYHIVGDEHSHAFRTLDGRYIQRVADIDGTPYRADADLWRYVEAPLPEDVHPSAQAPVRRAADHEYTSFPTIGEVRGLVLLVEFKDVQFQAKYDSLLFDRQFNEEGYSDYKATGSARDYFIAQSHGLFTPHFDVVGPIRLDHNESYYGSNHGGQDSQPGQMVVDACTYAHDSLGIDFSQYDFNDDGEVDFVFCLYAGHGENYGAPSSTIWPHMSYLKAQWINCTLDDKDVNLYACSCELKNASGTSLDGIGAVCHEFGHVLGLPDMYDTYYSSGVQLGQWDVMDSGSYNNDSRTPASYTAFERHMLGWMDFIDLTEPQDSVFVPEINESNVAYRIRTAKNPDEFFTLENHQKQGWDAAHPGRGLMIIHVLYDKGYWDCNAVNNGLTPRYDLVEADGTQGYQLSTDLYPISGNDMFTDYSTPNSLAWDKTPTERGVTHITQHNDGSISFKFMNDHLLPPELLPATCVTDSSFCAQWSAVDGATSYQLHVLEEIPDSLNVLLMAEDFSLLTEGKYPNAVNKDVSNKLDDYMLNPGWTGEALYPCGGLIRIGAYGTSGKLTSPAITCPDGTLTLSFVGCAYTGKSVNYSVELLDADRQPLQTYTDKATRDISTPVIVFNDCPTVAYLSINSSKERLFIDELRIGRGELDSLTLWSAAPREWDFYISADSLQSDSISDVAANPTTVSYNVTSLLAGRTYQYWVKAIDPEPLCSSDATEVAFITLPDESASGIQQVKAEQTVTGIYTLQGRCISAPIHTLSPGIYIIDGRKRYIR